MKSSRGFGDSRAENKQVNWQSILERKFFKVWLNVLNNSDILKINIKTNNLNHFLFNFKLTNR